MPIDNILTKEDIANTGDREMKQVEVEEWGGTVCLKELDGLGRDAFEKDVTARQGENKSFDITGLRTKLLSLVICDIVGELLFAGAEGVEILNGKSAKVIARLFEIAQKMNNIGEEALEEAEKN